jgi:hypothetical protein
MVRYPAPALVAIVLGTGLAVWLVPEDPQPADALFPAALAMAVGLAAGPVAAGLGSARSLLRGEHLLALAPVYWLLLDPLQGAYPFDLITQADVREALVGIGVFAIGVWLGALQRPLKAPSMIVRAASAELSARAYFRVTVLAFVLGMLKFAIPCGFNVLEMFRYLGNPRWDAPWGRGQFGGWDAFQDHLQYFGYLLPALTVIVARRSRWLDPRTLSAVAMSIVMALFLSQGGGRRIIGVIFGMALILWMLTETRLKARHMAAVAVSVVLLLTTLQFMLTYRNVGLGTVLQDADSVVDDRGYLHVDDNLFRFCQIIQFIPDSYPYVYHRYLVWVLVRPIPRIFWPGKPVDPGFDLPSALGVSGVSYSCSAVGEFFMSGGLLGIAIGGWLYGRVSGIATRLLSEGGSFGSAVIYSGMMMSLFVGVRSMLELVLMSYVVIAWAGLSHLARRMAPPRARPARGPSPVSR